MKEIIFTKETIANLAAIDKAYWVKDYKTPCLRLRVSPKGIKTYQVCRKVDGIWVRIKIARAIDITIDQARKKAIEINAQIALGENPHADKQAARKEMTFKELYNYYYSHHALIHTKRPRANLKTMEYWVFPEFGNVRGSDMTPDRLRKFHARIAESRSPRTANRVITIVAATFNFCIKNSMYAGVNPCASIKRYKSVSRDRFLTREELQSYFDALRKEEQRYQDFFLILLYTASRKTTVLTMKYRDIDFNLRRWRIPESQSKNGEVNIVVLNDPAMLILKRRFEENNARFDKSDFVFPGDGKDGHFADPKRPFNRIKERMGIKNFRMHDLRRTLASYMAISGASMPIIGKALNHKSHVSTSIYARLSQEPVLDAMNAAVSIIRDSGKLPLFRSNYELVKSRSGPVRFEELF